jgi:hypothetical protein
MQLDMAKHEPRLINKGLAQQQAKKCNQCFPKNSSEEQELNQLIVWNQQHSQSSMANNGRNKGAGIPA